MNITLTPEQVQLIQQKLQSGRYQTIEELLTQAFQLLDDWDEQTLTEDPTWLESTRQKVDAVIQSLDNTGGYDGETVVTQLIDRFRQARETPQ